MEDTHTQQARRFNRIVTQHVGALESSYLKRGRPLGEARLLYEIDTEGIDVRVLRERLKLDSGYISRLLRSLEMQELVRVEAQAGDARVRRVVLTSQGQKERAVYDSLSDALAQSMLAPLDQSQQGRLLTAMAEVELLLGTVSHAERQLRTKEVMLRVEAPGSAAAQWCLEQYFRELSARFDVGFDPARSNAATIEEMTPPAGLFLVAFLDSNPVGCGALKVGVNGIGEIKRMWTAPSARGMGIARTILQKLEASAREMGLVTLRLETNRVLIEAQSLYRQEGYREVAPFNAEPYAHHWFEKSLSSV